MSLDLAGTGDPDLIQYNLLGQQVVRQRLHAGAGIRSQALLAAGAYVARVVGPRIDLTRKLMTIK